MADEYPKTVPLKDGATVRLRPMLAEDAERVAALYATLPPDDLLFLREDLTRPEIVRRWASDSGDTSVLSILAEQAGRIVGQASLHRNRPRWSNHVAEIQVAVDPAYRRRGLGALLTQEIFVTAVTAGIDKIIAEMTPAQHDARRVFEQLGFRAEGLLTHYVQDLAGNRQDIVILAHDVDAFLRKMEAFGVSDTFDRGSNS